MSFPAYDEYKDSGVEFLGKVPNRWPVLKLRRCLLEHRQGYYSSDTYVDEGVKLLRITDLGDHGQIDISECPRVVDSAELEPFLLELGDFVFARTGGAGTFGLAPKLLEPVIYASYLIRFRFDDDTTPDFLRFFFQASSFQDAIKQNIHGGVNQNVHAEDIKDQYIALPLVAEQKAITSFLDVETSKIDGLVSEQRRLIELLKEKRQAVISHAVTKGLNPNAPMKPSGIQWLGDVPEHWSIGSVRRVINAIEQGWSPQCDSRPAEANEWGILKTGCVNRGVFSEIENKALPHDLEPIAEYEVKSGDVLMSRASGSTDFVGATAFVFEVRPKLMLSDKTFRIHLAESMEPRFFVSAFNSQLMRAQIEQSISGAEGLANNLPQSKLKCFTIVLPPRNEQVEIVNELALRCKHFDTLQAEAERAIELLQERRTALISAAVTGKIDVRGFASKGKA